MNIAPSQADKKCALQVAEVLAQAGHPVIPASLLHACAPASVKSPRQAESRPSRRGGTCLLLEVLLK